MKRERRNHPATFPNVATGSLSCLVVVFIASVAWLPAFAQDTVRATSQSSSQLRLIRNVVPAYPPIAQSARVSGMVIIEATIGPSGRVTEARVTRSVPLLDAPALDAVRQWEFAAPPVDARLPVVATVVVNFVLEQDPGQPRASGLPLPPDVPPDVPQDFAFSYEYRCIDGGFRFNTTSDLLFRSDNRTPIRLGLTGNDVAVVYRELLAMGFFASREGLSAWPAPAPPPAPAVPERSFQVTVSAAPPSVSVVSAHVPERKAGYSLVVRNQGWWMQAWPLKVGARPETYEKQIGAVSDLISRTVEQKDAWRQLPRERYSCR